MKIEKKFVGYVFALIMFLAIIFRFYNYPNFLYFIYDQGRDAQKIKTIVEGDLTLIGPTSGLEGFFLGPLWYYVGVFGYVLGSGSPYGISLWYIFVACLALPVYYLILKRLFPDNENWQIIAFALLSFIPASINASTFIWNPLLSLPLMALAIFSLLLARKSRLWLFLSFIFLGFVLHSEFAYGVFLIPVLFLLSFWIRKKFSILDYLSIILAMIITLVPQIVFEIKNNFLMSRSLLNGVLNGDNSISFSHLLSHRPMQLFYATRELIFGNNNSASIMTILAIIIIILGIVQIWKKKIYEWQIISIVAVLPYLGFMFWRGNHGNFFNYYMTPHFILLILLLVYGISEFKNSKFLQNINKHYREKFFEIFSISFITILAVFSWMNISNSIISPVNEAGIRTIDTATRTIIDYIELDKEAVLNMTNTQYDFSVATFTPNYLTAQYDYMMQWRSRLLNKDIPNTQIKETDDVVYLIIEPDREIPEKRFSPWYAKATTGRVRVRKEMEGVLLLETWVKPEFVLKNGFVLRPDNVRDMMCWN